MSCWKKVISKLRKKAFYLSRDLEEKEHQLLYLFLELTRRCNLNCRHCGSDCSKLSSMGEMDSTSWISILHHVVSSFKPAPVFVLTGGEPLVRTDLFAITEEIGKIGALWGMVSNGYLFDKERLDTLIDHGIHSLTLSLDGEEKSHNYIRNNPHSFDKTIKIIKEIGKSSLPYRDVVTCVYPENQNELEQVGNRLVDMGINSWRLFRIFPKGRAANDETLLLNKDQSTELIEWIHEYRKSFKKKGLNLSFSCEGYLPFKQDLGIRDQPFFCRSGINFASILSDGTITGCNNNGPDFYQGHIADKPLRELWENGFDDMRNRDWLKTGICSDCSEWNYCKGNSIHLRSKDRPGPDFCFLK